MINRDYFDRMFDAITAFINFIRMIDWRLVALFFGIFILIIFIFVGRDVFYKNSLICKHFADHIYVGDYIRDQFYLAVRHESLRMYDKYDYDYADREIELYDYFDSMIFFHDEDSDGSFACLNHGFCDFVSKYHSDYTLSDFSSAVIKYRRYYEHHLRQQQDRCKSEQLAEAARICDIKSAARDSRVQRPKIIYDHIKDFVQFGDMQMAYQRVFDDIKTQGQDALMPCIPVKNKGLHQCLCRAVILPHDRIQDMAARLPNVPAVCICYDTYSEKYYITNTDKLSDFLKSLFIFDELDPGSYVDEFKADIHIGHKVFVKILLLNQFGLIDSNKLRDYLVDCYDSVYPHGYNCRKIS